MRSKFFRNRIKSAWWHVAPPSGCIEELLSRVRVKVLLQSVTLQKPGRTTRRRHGRKNVDLPAKVCGRYTIQPAIEDAYEMAALSLPLMLC